MKDVPAASIRRPPKLALACGALFIAANMLVPLTLGDVYPFTIAPMFRDAPRAYCNYRVYSLDGELLADNSTRRVDPPGKPDPFLIRRYYDGNPAGLGVGVCPPKCLDCGQFGGVQSPEEVRKHFQRALHTMPELTAIDVEQEVVGPIGDWRVGAVKTHRYRIERASP
jgi:hypothetical protein